MRVLVATARGQGQRKNDYSHTIEGEYVRFGMECDGERIDGACGCRRGLAGFDSSKAGTTFLVTDRPVTGHEYREALGAAMVRDGWVDDASDPWVAEMASDLLAIAAAFPAGTVIEKRGATYQERRLA